MESGDSEEHFQNMHKLKLSSSEDRKSNSGTLETVNDAIITDDSSEVDDTQEDSSKGEDSSILPANMDDAVFHNDNRPVLDVSVFNGPTFEVDKQQIAENTELPKNSLVNTRALPKEATTYRLESFKKHALLILNQNFSKNPKLTRFGTERDVEALRTTFKNFGFEVTPHDDLTKAETFQKLKEFSECNYTDYGCVAVAILTHGSESGKLYAADQTYLEIDVINQFNVGDVNKSTLVSKPKIFIIQACRGSKTSSSVSVHQPSEVNKDHATDLKTVTYNLPLESDLLIFHSSYPGSASHRIPLEGSWFIQTLCKKIDSLSLTHDLESIITEVKRAVAIDMEYEKDMNINKQMPIMTSTLIRKLELKKFGERAVEETKVYELQKVVRDVPSMTPMVSQVEPCSCYLEHFTYMRNCLRYFVAENPNDKTGREILTLADTLTDSDKFKISKEDLCKVMSKHIMDIINSDNASCSCCLEHFTFKKNCLKYFVAENPNDITGQELLAVADTFKDIDVFKISKKKFCKVMSKHVMGIINSNNAQ